MHLLPTLNAVLNLLASVLLVAGWWAIKRSKDPRRHKTLMLSAFSASALFLLFYLVNRYIVGGFVTYPGDGLDRIIYLAILFPHMILAIVMLPFIFAALYFAFRMNFAAHVKVVKWAWPVWLFVSVTGVVIYLMLYVFPPAG
jgi:putative membrane protein